MDEKSIDFELSDEELKFNLLRIINVRADAKRINPFELQGVFPKQHDLEQYTPIEQRNHFLVFNDEEEKLKQKLRTLLAELERDGWVIKGTKYGDSFYELTENGKKKFEAREFDDWKQITTDFIDSTLKVLPNNSLRDYFNEAWISYNDRRMKIAPIFLLGAVSEGIINILLNQYETFSIRNLLSDLDISKGIASNYTNMINHFKTNKVKKIINSKIKLSPEENNSLDELENYCLFLFTIYRHSRNDTGHLKPIEITRDQIKIYVTSFKKYVGHINSIIDILNKI